MTTALPAPASVRDWSTPDPELRREFFEYLADWCWAREQERRRQEEVQARAAKMVKRFVLVEEEA